MGSAFQSVVSRAISIASSFALTVWVARLLGPDDAGLFFFWLTALTVLATVGRFGTDNLALKILGKPGPNSVTNVTYGFLVAFGASLIVLSACVCWAILFGDQQTISIPVLIFLMSALIPQAFTVVGGSIMRTSGMIGVGVFFEIGAVPASTMIVILAVNGIATFELAGALICLATGSWVAGAISIFLAAHSLRRRGIVIGSWQVSWDGFKLYMRQNFRSLSSMSGTSVVYFTLTWAPIFALTLADNLTGVAHYTVAMRLANLLLLVSSLQISYLAPSFARLYASGDLAQINALTRRATRIVLFALIVPVSGLVTMAPWVLRTLYGEEYVPAAGILAVLSMGTLVVSLLGHVNQLMLLCDLEHIAFIMGIIALAVWILSGLLVASVNVIAVAFLGAGVTVFYAFVGATTLFKRRGIRSFIH